MHRLNKIFFRGLLTIIPIGLTLYVLFWIVSVMENLLGRFLRTLVPEAYYIPGFGVIATFALIFFFGLLLNNFVLGEIYEQIEKKLKEIPVIKAIYSPISEVMGLFSKDGTKGMKGVVLVKIGNAKVMGIVTRENFKDIPGPLATENRIAVYCPYSYGVGGFTLLIPKEDVEEIDIPVEKAMSLAITAWVKTDKKTNSEANNGK